MNIEFTTSADRIRKVSSTKQYWFVRTYSGATFSDFYERNYIGVGFNEVPQEYITSVQGEHLISNYDRLREYINNHYEYEGGEVTKWANQLVAFQHQMRVGDCVIIPSKNSEVLAIGEIESDVYLVNENRTFEFNEKYERYPEKRRRVYWQTTKKKEDFRGDIDAIFHSRQAIYNVDRLAQVIEGYISPLFMIDNTGYFVIEIKQDDNINAFAFSKFLNSITYFYDEICEELGIESNEELYLKIKVQSKGKVALKAITIGAILGISTIFALSDHPDIKLELRNYGTFEASGDGFLNSWSNFLDRKQERKIRMMEYMESKDSLIAEPADTTSLPDDEITDYSQEEREESN